MDLTLRKLTPPKWPENIFGEIDQDLAKKGLRIFNDHPIQLNSEITHCASCHSQAGGETYPVDLIGTEPGRWALFNSGNGPDKLRALATKVKKVRAATMDAAGIKKETYDQWEINGPPVWRETTGYVAHQLGGIWASPPYLHNGSVRTLYQLLLPEEERETQFFVGSREFDPKHIGYVNKPGPIPYKLDTTRRENSNKGHDFGRNLLEDERLALIEYLKSL